VNKKRGASEPVYLEFVEDLESTEAQAWQSDLERVTRVEAAEAVREISLLESAAQTLDKEFSSRNIPDNKASQRIFEGLAVDENGAARLGFPAEVGADADDVFRQVETQRQAVIKQYLDIAGRDYGMTEADFELGDIQELHDALAQNG
jgi:hypothetical protein